VRRDIAVIVDEKVAAGELIFTLCNSGRPLVTDVVLFDVYRGKGVPEGRKSLAFRVLLQDTEKTLTDVQVDAMIQRLIKILNEKHGGDLRS
jgi:phenylalanyl-tRNA synthetase beta chain